MFLVMILTGQVGNATAEHLLANGKNVRTVRGCDWLRRPTPTTAFL